jgi:hypothetical protein
MSAVLAYRDICVIDNAISADEQRHIVLRLAMALSLLLTAPESIRVLCLYPEAVLQVRVRMAVAPR